MPWLNDRMRQDPPGASDTGAHAQAAFAARIRAYLACLTIAFLVYAVVHGLRHGLLAALACAVVLAMLSMLLAAPALAGRDGMVLRTVALAAALVCLAWPLGGLLAGGATVPRAVAASVVWPQVLVCLFSARVLAENNTQRFAEAWRRPMTQRPVGVQAMTSALVLGASLGLVFYQVLGFASIVPGRLDPTTIVLRALAGETAIHVAIVLLFFVTLAAIFDAWLLALDEATALATIRALCRSGGRHDHPPLAISALAASARLSGFDHTRVVQSALARGGAKGGATLAAFHLAARRMIRALLSFLPLLGFLGTVIGLTAAMGGLPSHIGPDAETSLDINASLFGLAVKFETTLLGLSGALVGSLLLALLEKREAEVAAGCERLVESLPYA